MSEAPKLKDSVQCKYCANQGLVVLAHRLRGLEGATDNSTVTRYGCSNGHKFAVLTREVTL